MIVTETGDFLLTVSSYTKPVEELLYAPKTERLNDTGMNWQSAVDFNDIEPNGEFNTTEYGSVKNRDQFLAKYGYSPYHHVTDGVKYPAVLIAAGENDHRVGSWHGKKMAARLQAATSSGLPILLSVSTTAGHGFGTAFAERLKNEATLYTFFYDQLAIGASPIRKQ